MFKDFCTGFSGNFSRSFWETIYCTFGVLQKVFQLTKVQSVETLHHSKLLSRKTCPRNGNSGIWGILAIGHTLIYPFHLNFPEVVIQL